MNKSSSKPEKPVILVTGKDGQVGWELQRTLMPLGSVIALGQQQMNLADSDQVRTVIRDINPAVIVNAAAYTAVDKAEDEAELVMQVNATAPVIMAEEASRSGALLVHYSTDYVFNGSKQDAWTETDQPDPINLYGKSKLEADLAITASSSDHLVFRTSWVYASRGQNFLLTMARLIREHNKLNIVDDQVGAPTWARLIAETTAIAVQQSLQQKSRDEFQSELLHLASSGETSWFGFASAIRAIISAREGANVQLAELEAINSSEYPVQAARPANSRLDCRRLEQRFGLALPDWKRALELCMDEKQN
ncbi:dTDP-4-dehydrorhamnose reductase [Solemya velum gill symbiont]|uniref:dTDP-4-dehydrorhamnose reductase n=2 Tax=Solemya velum gill symbiont TaxID=2340 RepID=A0A0B0HB86_SOVGS|nr:dTDP-4-dehydrorhamnose reductase [Solemya velum gill symbiont]KHF25887.1 dTDP-4-dehydrorhamnose reductase [Solemya velum gill symbiont]